MTGTAIRRGRRLTSSWLVCCTTVNWKRLTCCHTGEMGGIKVFMSRGQLVPIFSAQAAAKEGTDVPQPKEVLGRKRESLARFVHIIHPLAEVYGLPTSSLHIFYDLTGGTIAFNRSASIFLNLRFFEAWRTP